MAAAKAYLVKAEAEDDEEEGELVELPPTHQVQTVEVVTRRRGSAPDDRYRRHQQG